MRAGLRAKRNSGGLGPDSVAFVFFLAMIFFTLYNLLFGRYNLLELKKMKESIGDMEKRIETIKKENALIKEELELLEKDRDFYLEKLAREKMQLQRPDEKIILFKND
ncbi:FtsB family cell division protein [Thermocrinis sp.]